MSPVPDVAIASTPRPADEEVTIVIPARYASTRFPGKPLIDLLGKPMIQWVYEKSASSKISRRVIVATDDERIAEAVRGFGGEVAMTSPNHPTGTDRLAEVAERLPSGIIVNVQGDEPTLNPNCIAQVVAPLLAGGDVSMSTLRTVLSPEDHANPNIVKVVVDRQDLALYFSRLPIPYLRERGVPTDAFKHIGLYAYHREFLLAFPRLPVTPLEQSEALEQLRALEHGYRIAAPLTSWNPISIDTPDDVAPVLERLAK